jgi:hypothetical protein
MDGNWTPKKRKLLANAAAARTSFVDFSVENPLDGKLKDSEFVKELLLKHKNQVFQRETSYCHFNTDYRKRTFFLTTLSRFAPAPPCPANPCTACARDGRHARSLTDAGQAERNSIPSLLVDQLVHAWIGRYEAGATSSPPTRFLFIDVFSGFGSVLRRVNTSFPTVKTFANDIVKRQHTDANLDMSVHTESMLTMLVGLALQKHFSADLARRDEKSIFDFLKEARIAVLFHLSTPCNTYSQLALSHHRVAGSAEAKSAEAAKHDEMNARLLECLAAIAL